MAVFVGKAAAFLDAFEEGFAGGYVSENERGTRTDGCVYEIGRARPFDVDEWCVNEEELLEGDMVDQKDGHGLAVLASRVVDGNQGASSDESAGFLGDGNAGSQW